MSTWSDIKLGLCLVLLAGLLWMEWRRANRARLFMRCVATVVAVGALACLGLPIYYWRDVVRPSRVVEGPHLTEAASGVVAIDWRRRLGRGERLVVSGRWAGGPGRVLLVGMGEVVDSVNLAAAGPFSLGVVPAQMGRAVYRLVSMVGKDTVAREDVPVEVETGKPLKLLLLASAPDFENRFLIKWLSGDGHVVASRTMLSRGKAEESFVNREPVELAALTTGLLAGFDVVIADAAALPARGTVERGVLQREITDRGMGLVLKVDSLGLDSLLRVMRGRVSRVLVRDSAGKVMAGAFSEGSGKVIFTALNTSYSRLLAGDRGGYAGYWAELLREGRGKEVEEWRWSPELPRVGEETVVQLQTAAEQPQGMVGERVVYLAQDAELRFLWSGKYWPERAGWQAVSRPMGDTAWMYVWPRGAWKGVVRPGGAAVRAGVAVEGSAAAGGRVERERVELPIVWFWGLFLLGAVFLWVERKMGGMNG